MLTKHLCAGVTQLQRKPEIKEEAVVTTMTTAAAVGAGPGLPGAAAYGRKTKEPSCRPRTAKEEWKEREATLGQALPTRIKIFEGGSVRPNDCCHVCHWPLRMQSLIIIH